MVEDMIMLKIISLCMWYRWSIFSSFYRNSESNVSVFQRNLEEMFIVTGSRTWMKKTKNFRVPLCVQISEHIMEEELPWRTILINRYTRVTPMFSVQDDLGIQRINYQDHEWNLRSYKNEYLNTLLIFNRRRWTIEWMDILKLTPSKKG